MRISTALALTTSLMVLAEAQVHAQSGSLFGSNGLSSRGSSSSGLNGNSSGGGSQAGGSTANAVTGFTGQSAGSSSGFTSLGGSSFVGGGQNGFAGNRAASNSVSVGGGTGGGAGGAGGGMGGAGAGGGVGGIRGAGLGAQSFGRNNQRGGGGGGFGQNGFGMNGNQGFNPGSSATPRVVRPQQRIAFEYTPRTQTQVQASVATQFTRLQGIQFQGVAVSMDEAGEVTLTGNVPTEDARKLAAVLARIEPGVRSVSNNLVVGTP